MKSLSLVIVCFLFCGQMFGRIRNAYEADLENNQTSLARLMSVLAFKKNEVTARRTVLKARMESLITNIACYRITEELIDRFREIAPDIFYELDHLTDRRGRPTDVYIKMVPREKSRVSMRAASFFEPSAIDEDANHSRHGDFSVAIDIWIDDNALFLLSHELGHVKYIVPNLSNYLRFYQQRYPRAKVTASYIGHASGDQSGRHAVLYEKKFFEEKRGYLANGNRKPETFTALFGRFRREIRNLSDPDAIPFAKWHSVR